MKVRLALPFLLVLCSACGERSADRSGRNGSTTPPYVREESEPSRLGEAVVPVPVGELGPRFAACGGRGATRDPVGAEPVPVRAAPFDEAEVIDRLPSGATFFICARTYDQRWSAIVYDSGGTASERCAVSAPAVRRGHYSGPCAAGWVANARVRLVSGEPHQLPPEAVAGGN